MSWGCASKISKQFSDLEKRIDSLQKQVEDGPHDETCRRTFKYAHLEAEPEIVVPCDCWKKEDAK